MSENDVFANAAQDPSCLHDLNITSDEMVLLSKVEEFKTKDEKKPTQSQNRRKCYSCKKVDHMDSVREIYTL